MLTDAVSPRRRKNATLNRMTPRCGAGEVASGCWVVSSCHPFQSCYDCLRISARGVKIGHLLIATKPTPDLMIVFPEPTSIRDIEANVERLGSLVRLQRDAASEEIDIGWWNHPEVTELWHLEDDRDWDWRALISSCQNKPLWHAIAVRCHEGQIQGAILYRANGVSRIESEKGSVFIEYLASAPWNRDWLTDRPRFRGAGECLIFTAVRHSYLLGLGGRVTVAAIDNDRTVRFYKNRGFEAIDLVDGGTIVYELPGLKALEWLDRMAT